MSKSIGDTRSFFMFNDATIKWFGDIRVSLIDVDPTRVSIRRRVEISVFIGGGGEEDGQNVV